MPLIADGELVEDPWRRPDGDAPPAVLAGVILPWADFLDLAARGPTGETSAGFGVEVPNDTPVTALAPFIERLALVAVTFPSAADGRGFSLARQLRGHGFTGELRARGPIIADQYAFARACGFDTVEIPESVAARQPPAQWRRAESQIERAYQIGYGGRQSILDLRHPRADAAAGETRAGWAEGTRA